LPSRTEKPAKAGLAAMIEATAAPATAHRAILALTRSSPPN